MNTLRAVAVALAVPAALALAGCASPAATDDADSAVILYDWDPNGPAMLALLTTKLELTDGCLMGEGGTYIAFPRDLATWNAADETLTYGDATFAVGDTINAGGGGGTLPDGASVPDACVLPEDGTVFLVQTTSLS